MQKVAIVVLGDIGRSPRMKYHALSLATEDFLVNFIGYEGTDPGINLRNHKNVKLKYLLPCPNFNEFMPTVLAYVFKTLWQSITLMIALITIGLPRHILVQNPPSIPTLGVCYIFSRLTRAQFIIDWHNYAYTIMGISLGRQHSLVNISKRFEFLFGRRSDKNICVTRAMKDDLKKEHEITATTFYDRPLQIFKPVTIEERHTLFRRLGEEYEMFTRNCEANETLFTISDANGIVSLKPHRPALLISSTSWTEDEDFSLLLDALQDYELMCLDGRQLPQLIVVITGKGPLKQFYTEAIARRKWKHVTVITPWLSAEDYPQLLACGDLGVSLHYSSSGLDLPMKVVDMFGCGLPVCAVDFKCLSELVVHKQNGMVFQHSRELSQQIQEWFNGFPTHTNDDTWRSTIRVNLDEFRRLQWHENWLLTVKPIFNQ